MTTRSLIAILAVGLGLAAAIFGLARARKPVPAPPTYVAFSLREAQVLLTSNRPSPDIDRLAGISSVAGFVYDRHHRDVILIGRRGPGEPFKLANLVAAMRALMVTGKWPAVSIDPPRQIEYRRGAAGPSIVPRGGGRGPRPDETPSPIRAVDITRTDDARRQIVRLEAGVADTEFGEHLLDADIVLKGLALGAPGSVDWKGESYFDRCARSLGTRGGEATVASRFWFVPREPTLWARGDVFAISHLDLGVAVEVLRGLRSGPEEPPADAGANSFAADLTRDYRTVARLSPAVGKLQGLLALVAVARGIQSIDDPSAVRYWLRDYHMPRVPTPRTYPTLIRCKTIDISGTRLIVELEGGIRLRSSLVRLHDGDYGPLERIVLAARPSPDALSWPVPVDDWSMAGTVAATDDPVPPPAEPAAAPGCYIQGHIAPALEPFTAVPGGFAVPPLPYTPPKLNVVGHLTLSDPSFKGDDHLRGEEARPISPADLKLGGVWIDPKLLAPGESGSALPNNILKSRPNPAALSWQANLPARQSLPHEESK